MLSEIAIDDPKTFAGLVETAKKALDGKAVKAESKAEVKEETKKEAPKKETKEEKTDISKLTVAELKAMAKEELVDALK